MGKKSINDKVNEKMSTKRLLRYFLSDHSDKAQNILRLRKDPKSTEPLIAYIYSDVDSYWKGRACEILGEIGDARAVDALLHLIKFGYTHNEVFNLHYASAFGALVKIGDKRVIPVLANLPIKPALDGYKYDTLDKLGWYPETYLNPMMNPAGAIEYYLHTKQLEKIYAMPKSQVVSYLMSIYPRNGGDILSILIEMDAKEACPYLVPYISQPQLKSINGMVSDRELSDQNDANGSRIAVIRTLGALRCPGAIGALVNILKNPDKFVWWFGFDRKVDNQQRVAAVEALEKYGEDAYEGVKELIEPGVINHIFYCSERLSPPDNMLEQCVQTVCATKVPGLFEHFEEMYRKRDVTAKNIAVTGLGLLGDKRAIPILKRATKSTQWNRSGSVAYISKRYLEILKK
jgi:HEAT repeat protein